jgi:peroxiredoxin
VGFGILALVLLSALLALLLVEPPPDPLGRGVSAPDFRLPALDGGEQSLVDWRGRVVLLNFWATWCKPCEDEMPAMQRLVQELEGEPFELVAISVDTDVEAVRAFRDRLALTFPILLDSDSSVSGRYQTTGYPESFLLDRSGQIASQRFIGPRAWDDPDYVALVKRLVQKSP